MRKPDGLARLIAWAGIYQTMKILIAYTFSALLLFRR